MKDLCYVGRIKKYHSALLDRVVVNAAWQSILYFGTDPGKFNVTQDPWIRHPQHGWMYSFGRTTASITFWDSAMGAYWWTSDSQFPYQGGKVGGQKPGIDKPNN